MYKKGINTDRKKIVGNCFIIVSYHAIVNIYSCNMIMVFHNDYGSLLVLSTTLAQRFGPRRFGDTTSYRLFLYTL